jgi:NitT/TauT family transport system substrate-binding protein
MPALAAADPCRRTIRRTVTVLTAALAVTSAAGCGSQTATASRSAVSNPAIVIGALPAIGSAPIYIALDEGLFKKAGLNVTVKTLGAPSTVLADLLHGQINCLQYQWTAIIAAQEAGVARLRAIAAAQSLGPRSHEILVLPHSHITTVAQLKGKTIGIQSLGGLDAMLVGEALAAYRITLAQVRLVAIPFQSMEAALAAHRVDAVEPAEPYVTLIEEKLGAQALADMDQGATQDFPVAGYVVTTQFQARYPRTVAALARALDKANAIADSNPAALQRAMIQDAHISAEVAATVSVGTFPTSVDLVQLQRVADLMHADHEIPQPFNVAALTR